MSLGSEACHPARGHLPSLGSIAAGRCCGARCAGAGAGRPSRPASRLAHQLLERGLVADRVEVGVVGSERAEPLRPVDREPEVLDRVRRPPREALTAREVVERPGVLRMGFDQLASRSAASAYLPDS
jgi:hypothetical protein